MPRRPLAAGVAAAALAAVAVAAVLHGPPATDDAGAAAQGPAPPDGLGPDRMVWSGCSGWSAAAQFPRGTSPGTPPPGWEEPPGGLTGVDVVGLACQRIALGPFERGPVHLVLETHGNARVPQACQGEPRDVESPKVLATLLLDDAELAAELQRAHGLPARVAAFEADGAAAPAGPLEWSWAEAGQEPSRLQLVAESAPGPGHAASFMRVFWPHGDGLASLGLALEETTSPGHRPATGHFASPMLLSGTAGGEFAGLGKWLPALEATGLFSHFRDPLCEAPA